MTDPTQTAEALQAATRRLEGKPVLASWMGGPDVAAGEAILNQAGIPTFAYPDTAARAFNYMWRYTYNLRGAVRDARRCRRRPDRTARPRPGRGADPGRPGLAAGRS